MLDNNAVDSLLSNFYTQKNIITDIQLQPYNIKLIRPWKTSSSQLLYKQGLLVSLTINNSFHAIGECAPMPEIGTETLAQAQNYFFHHITRIKGRIWGEKILSDLESLPACRFALESILLIFIAQQQDKNIANLFNTTAPQSIKTNIMLGSLDNDSRLKIKQAEQEGFRCIKFKFGLDHYKTEIHQLHHILAHIQADTLIRLDANKIWSFEQTLWILNELEPYHQRIDSIEEPLLNYDENNYRKLQDKSSITLALDESFSSAMPFKQYPVRRLVLKPMAQGGLLNTLKLAKTAQQYEIETVITSSIETGYGLQMLSQCCAALNNNQYHGIATASWLADPIIEPPDIKDGIASIDNKQIT